MVTSYRLAAGLFGKRDEERQSARGLRVGAGQDDDGADFAFVAQVEHEDFTNLRSHRVPSISGCGA